MALVDRRALDGTSLSVGHAEDFLDLIDQEHTQVVLEEFSDTTRPSPVGNRNRVIFNTDEGPNGALNVSNGTNWLTAAGVIT